MNVKLLLLLQCFALLCTTAQQSYCHGAGVRRLPSVVRRYPSINTSFSRKPSSGLTPNLGERYLSTISPDHFLLLFLKILNFYFLLRFFSFSLTWDHMGEQFQSTSPLKVHNRFTLNNPCILLAKVSTKGVQRIVKFKILYFCHFFSLSSTWHGIICE